MVLEELAWYMQKMKLDQQLTPYTRINSEWINDIGSKISDILRSNIFDNISSRARETNEKIDNWYYIKLKSLCTAKETTIKMKREPNIWENMCL